MDTASYDLDHFFNLKTAYDLSPYSNRDTNQGHPQLSDNEILGILRALRPISSDPASLFFYSDGYNPVISDEELSRLRIQFHHLDIETGDVSPSSISCFLPRTNVPELSEANDYYPDVFGGAKEELVDLRRGSHRGASSLDIFGHCLWLTFKAFSFEGNEDFDDEFTDRYRQDGPLNHYGWISDL